MKKFSMYIMLGIFLTACSAEDTLSPVENVYVPLTFSASQSPASRAVDDKWEFGDAIGVSVVNVDSSCLETQNRKYVNKAAAGNEFLAADKNQQAYLKVGTNYHVIAYYPRIDNIVTLSDGRECVKIDLSNQSDPSKIDLMTAQSSLKAGQNSNNVPLQFTHRLKKLVINISAGNNLTPADLEGIKVEILNQNRYALLPLTGTEVEDVREYDTNIQMKTNADGTMAEAIVHRYQTHLITLLFTLNNKKTFTGYMTFPGIKDNTDAGYKYIYDVKINN